MPDRIIRDELLNSERWLNLPTDTHRLVFAALILICDDYGNLEGGPRRLYRWMQAFTQIKTEPDAIKLMSDLQDAEMVLRYETEGDKKEYWHITRFRNSRRYWSRKFPQSPYQEQSKPVDKKEQIEIEQEPMENVNAALAQIGANLSGGVGVGVGDTYKTTTSPTRSGPCSFLLENGKRCGSKQGSQILNHQWICALHDPYRRKPA